MSIFLTTDSENLKGFIRKTQRLVVEEVRCLTRSEKMVFKDGDFDIRLKVVDVLSVEQYTLLLYLNTQVVVKFLVKGIQEVKVNGTRHEYKLLLVSGVMRVVFKVIK